MEKEKVFMGQGNRMLPGAWNSSNSGMEIEVNNLNCGSEQLPNCYCNPNWESSMDQSDPFESALSSMVSSPAASGIPNGCSADGESMVLRELIGRLGGICNSSGEINSSSTHNSCYATPLNSPPKLNLSLVDHQIRRRGGSNNNHNNNNNNNDNNNNLLPNHPSLAPLSADPGFAERAAKLSCFGNRNFGSLNLNGQFGVNGAELPQRLAPSMVESSGGKLSRVSSNQSIKVAAGSPMDHHVREIRDGLLQDNGNSTSASDKKKFNSSNRLSSRSSTPENPEFGDSREESSVSEQIPGTEEIGIRGQTQNDAKGRKRKSIARGKAKETTTLSSSSQVKDSKLATDSDESNAKRSKSSGNENDAAKLKSEASENGKQTKDSAKPPEPPKDYIHVRARRGQATDAHSLAERVRREKISQRMKFLQDLVPGCNKVTGKAVMLDEIINYVQSLQRQVEFLSLKLATVNPKMDFNMEALLSKDIFHSPGSMTQNIYPLEAMSPAFFPYGFQSPQGPLLQNAIANGTETAFSMNPSNAALHQNQSTQLPHIDGFGQAASQASTFLEDDLQSVVHMGFGQNQSQNIHGAMATSQMKVEL